MTQKEYEKIIHLMNCGTLHGIDTGRLDGKCEDVIPLEDAIAIIDKYRAKSEPQENNEGKLSWLGKSCKDCGNEKCKKLGALPKGYDCALWQAESEEDGEVKA